MSTSRARAAFLALPVTLVLAACAGGGDGADKGSGDGPITVTATDTACELSRTEAPAGTVEFAVTNKGSKINEFYVYAEGDRIMGEVENIGPGLSRTFHVELSEPGTYQTACKPGMVGDGIRADFTVTGSAGAAKSDDENLAAATATYQQYVAEEADEFLARTTEFVALVKAGKVAAAKALYPTARSSWERIEPVAESFGDLDPRIDGREDVVEEGMEFTGYHRLEKDLWRTALQKDSGEIADRLLADVTELVAKAKTVQLNPLQLANGSKALLDEIATGKITGEEERYSHTDLWDFDANFEGSKAALQALRPFLLAKDPELVETIDARGTALEQLLDSHHSGEGFVLYTSLGDADVKKLTEALDAFAEPVATVAGVVAKG
ncbi:iron uptake system protein EfeO [Phycicoccus sp.]|uniref:iron uptake system protein EfeO n=1 Tax=Phycicoccus sp. TaxID=1902410 RepID=UPI002CC0D727|nr:iron uptake system protein EfeO [Phycicoccus sp.]HMM94257.1 imelysin family protein [Phycicoccus sp.]